MESAQEGLVPVAKKHICGKNNNKGCSGFDLSDLISIPVKHNIQYKRPNSCCN